MFHQPEGVAGDSVALRSGGGSRGMNTGGLDLYVLVPDQLALTTQAQPSLYWYQNKTADAQCEVTVTEPKNPKPLLVLKTGKSTPAGIHAIRLSKFNVELKPNVVYKWSVAVVLDPAERSGDVIASGAIKRIDPSPEMTGKLAAPDADKASIFAENGLWYDALQSISDQIDKAPSDKNLRDERASLLDQVKLPGADMESNSPAPTPSKSP